jgi:predicted nucleic acid-binding protein
MSGPSQQPQPARQSPGRPRLTSFVVVLDANALAGAEIRDVLLSAAETCLYRPLWSRDILDEVGKVLERLGVPVAGVERLLDTMNSAFPEAIVDGYADIVDAMKCEHGDRHVLAAAVVGHAQLIVTWNKKDFPPESTAPYTITVLSPDEFLCDLLSLDHVAMLDTLKRISERRQRPPRTIEEIVDALDRQGCTEFARECRVMIESLFGTSGG